jgi:hypothetical protein
MRDKDGRALVNAHVLGFLRRICKLLFYGIKPVFVFDGGAPALKRLTLVSSSSLPLLFWIYWYWIVLRIKLIIVGEKEEKDGCCC